MRVEPHSIDSFVHVTKRGTRGLPIVKDEADRRRFVRLLYYANDQYRDYFWEANTAGLGNFGRPPHWPVQEPLVKVLAWSLMPNHFHLVLRELVEGGMAKFMQQLCGSMSMYFNKKYDESGSIFQGSYKGRTANTRGDEYLRLLAVYVMVKNPFELYPGGLKNAIKKFDKLVFQKNFRHEGFSNNKFQKAFKDRINKLWIKARNFRTQEEGLGQEIKKSYSDIFSAENSELFFEEKTSKRLVILLATSDVELHTLDVGGVGFLKYLILAHCG